MEENSGEKLVFLSLNEENSFSFTASSSFLADKIRADKVKSDFSRGLLH